MSYCDDKYTKVPKPAAPSYTVGVKPTATYTITAKGSRPTTNITQRPCLIPLAILTEHSIMITEEDTRPLTVEGTL